MLSSDRQDTESLDWDKLTTLFDLVMQRHQERDATPAPTTESIERINMHFGISLPSPLLRFARECHHFGGWFGSLGPDYESDAHIINVNTRARGRQEDDSYLPEGLVVFNLGYDEDYDCFDAREWNKESMEYSIKYWSPGAKEAMLSASFHQYIEKHIRFWIRGRRDIHKAATKILSIKLNFMNNHPTK